MGKYSGLLICSDFDGTLFCNGRVSEANTDAIRRFQEGGGFFTLATGRYPSILKELDRFGASFCCNAPLISMNGAILYDADREKILYEETMKRDYTDTLLEICRACDGIRELVFCPADEWKGVTVLPTEEDGIRTTLGRPLYKILVRVEPEKSDEIKATIARLSGENYTVSRSWIGGIEIQESHYDKGITARRLAKLLGADKLICIGDYENDVSMLMEADLGVAMGNATNAVKECADRVTASAEEDGFAKMIDTL